MIKKKLIKWLTVPIATLQTLLIVLRFIGRIDCSWWLVFLPVLIIGSLALFLSTMKVIFRSKK